MQDIITVNGESIIDDDWSKCIDSDVLPDYYTEMLCDMADIHLDVTEEPMTALERQRNAHYARLNANSFVHNTRRDGARTRRFYKKQATRFDRMAGKEIVRSF